nr:ABC transporter transmembrane domain-containing protein [bacterium]
MNLLQTPPESQKQALDAALAGEALLECLPCDIGVDGKLGQGVIAVTPTRILRIWEGALESAFDLADFTQINARAMIGNGIFEGQNKAGEPVLFGRFSMYQVPRYMQLARVVTRRIQKLPPPPDSKLEDRRCPKCGRMLPRNMRICPSCIDRGKMLKKLMSLSKPYWGVLLLAVFLMMLGNVVSLLSPYVSRYMVDNLLVPRTGSMALLAGLCGLMFSMTLAGTIINIFRGRMMVRLGARLSGDLRTMVYTKIQAMSLGYMNTHRTGDLMNRITGDTNRIKNFIEQQMPMVLNTVIMLIALVVILFTFDWRFAILVIIPVPVSVGILRLFNKRTHRMYHAQWRLSDKANSLLQDILSGIRVVKSFGKEQQEVGRYAIACRRMADKTKRNERMFNTLYPLVGLLMGLGNFFVMYYGSVLVLGEQMSVGQLVQYSTYAGMLFGPLNYLTNIPRWFAQTMTSAERVYEVLDEEPEIADIQSPEHGEIKGHVVFDHVTFGYEAYEPVLHDVSLEVQPGEIIGLVGASGSGKSTLTNLVLRLYDVQEGQLTIDGVDIRNLAMDDLRRQIGVVLQENFLFAGSIFENIRYAKPDATPEEVIRAAKIANAHDFITKFPDGYDTIVGENGQKLSGGERQRVAIARAILHNPRILILDEATASLDTETEKLIQDALQQLMKGRTVFAIAHRLSTLKNANRLVVLDKGRIAEMGPHDELLRQKGIYYHLVMMQRQLGRMRGPNADDTARPAGDVAPEAK